MAATAHARDRRATVHVCYRWIYLMQFAVISCSSSSWFEFAVIYWLQIYLLAEFDKCCYLFRPSSPGAVQTGLSEPSSCRSFFAPVFLFQLGAPGFQGQDIRTRNTRPVQLARLASSSSSGPSGPVRHQPTIRPTKLNLICCSCSLSTVIWNRQICCICNRFDLLSCISYFAVFLFIWFIC